MTWFLGRLTFSFKLKVFVLRIGSYGASLPSDFFPRAPKRHCNSLNDQCRLLFYANKHPSILIGILSIQSRLGMDLQHLRKASREEELPNRGCIWDEAQ